MEISLKYRIFNFLDNQGVEDYLSAIHLVARSFSLSLDEAESYSRKWYGGPDQWIFEKFYATTKTIADLYNRNLHTYQTSHEFWAEVMPELDRKTVELLSLLPEGIWLSGTWSLLRQRKREYINVA